LGEGEGAGVLLRRHPANPPPQAIHGERSDPAESVESPLSVGSGEILHILEWVFVNASGG